jgi:pilus assembly protein Flp/PilA
MKRLISSVVQFLRREDGPTAVEYAVMLSLIIIVCVASIAILGQKASSTFTTVGRTLGS